MLALHVFPTMQRYLSYLEAMWAAWIWEERADRADNRTQHQDFAPAGYKASAQ